jgi:hypothetical protein
MEIKHFCDIVPLQWLRKEKRKEEESKQKTCISEYLEPYFSVKSPPYLPI